MDYRNIKASARQRTDRGHPWYRRAGAIHGGVYVLSPTSGHLDEAGLRGSAIGQHLDPGPGAPTFAYLRDPSGNRFGVFGPPAA